MINLCIIINSKFLTQAKIFFNSLFKNNPSCKFNIYIMYSRLTQDELEDINSYIDKHNHKFYNIDMTGKMFEVSNNKMEKVYPEEVYYKVLLPEVIPNEVERLLYCDVDEIITEPIENLYNTDIANYKIGAVPDYFINKYNLEHKNKLGLLDANYFNTGVLLFNLREIRKEYDVNKAKEIVRKFGENIIYPDQDIFNILFLNQVLYFDEKYNYITKIRSLKDYREYKKNKTNLPVVLHYAGIKPLNMLYDGKYYDEYWKYAKEIVKEEYEQVSKKRKKLFFMIWLRRVYRFVFHVRKF